MQMFWHYAYRNKTKGIVMNLKKSIKQACLNENIKQVELADRLGIKPQQLSAIMSRGSTSIAMLASIGTKIKLEPLIQTGKLR